MSTVKAFNVKGDRVKVLRKAMGLSINDLAEKIGMSDALLLKKSLMEIKNALKENDIALADDSTVD